MDVSPDRSKSVQELEGIDWGEPVFGSHLVETCHQLRCKPLEQLSVEDLRIMIDQEIGLEFLIPLALEILDKQPLASGDLYCGDLLAAVARVKRRFWNEHADWLEQLHSILKRAGEKLQQMEEQERKQVHSLLIAAAASISSE